MPEKLSTGELQPPQIPVELSFTGDAIRRLPPETVVALGDFVDRAFGVTIGVRYGEGELSVQTAAQETPHAAEQDDEPDVAYLASMTPGQYIAEWLRLSDVATQEESHGATEEERTQIRLQSPGNQALMRMESDLRFFAHRYLDRARDLFDALRIHSNTMLRSMAVNLLVPLLDQEMTLSDPHPEGIIAAWGELLQDSDNDVVSPEAYLQLDELWNHHEATARKLSVYQVRQLLDIALFLE